MRRISILLSAVFLTMTAFKMFDEWKTIQLSDKISVSMPGDPKDEAVNNFTRKKLQLSGDAELSAMIIDYEKLGLDEAKTQELIQSGQLKAGMEQNLQAQGAKMFKSEEGVYGKDIYYQFLLQRPSDKSDTAVYRAVLHKTKCVMLVCRKARSEMKDIQSTYFSSLKIND